MSQALCWAWSDSRNLTDAFTQAVECSKNFGIVTAEHLPRLHGGVDSMDFPIHRFILVALASEDGRDWRQVWRIDGWVPIAFDGSRSSAPRTQANEKAFCATNYGRGKTARYRKKKTKGMRRKENQKNRPQPQEPQAWITMLWHMGLRFPWMWRLGPSNSSERGHVMEMMDAGKFPKNTLFCGDAGFVGYPLWSQILITVPTSSCVSGRMSACCRDSAH